MDNIRDAGRAMQRLPRWFAALLLFVIAVPSARSTDRVSLFPKLRVGQTVCYQISYHSDKNVNTHSSVVVATPAEDAKADARGLLRLEVVSVEMQGQRSLIRGRSHFDTLSSGVHLDVPKIISPAAEAKKLDPPTKFVDFTIFPDGRIDQVKGLEELPPEQQQAWEEWASRFSLAASIPAGIHVAQKWKSQEAEKSLVPIAGLRWVRESTYVRNEPCRSVQMTRQGEIADDGESESCAVILTTAALKQASSPRNATPEDFQLHELRTSGSARGANRIITYISLKTGLLVRASEEANQQMDVTVAKADGSNRVRYAVSAKSHSEILLVTETPLAPTNTNNR